MLDKVLNIEANKPYADRKSAARTYEKFIRQHQAQNFFPKDSIVFSPAAIYLSKLNWFVKEVQFTSDGKILFSFSISDYELQTTIDMVNFYKEERQKYFIVNKISDEYRNYFLSATISVNKSKINLEQVIDNYRLTGIRNLFSKINSMNFGTRLLRTDSYVLNGLLDGISDEISYEMEQIQNAVYTFIQKFDKFKINENYFKNINSEFILLERISKEYAEQR